MPSTVAETRKANEARGQLLGELRKANARMQSKAPGSPAVELPLDKVLTFAGDGGPRAVIEVEQVIYIVDRILRDAAEQEKAAVIDDQSRAIHKAAGILVAAYFLHGRADRFRDGTARGQAIAVALDQAADDLKTLAAKTRDSMCDLEK